MAQWCTCEWVTAIAASGSTKLAGTRPRSPDAGLTVTDLVERIAVGGWPGLLEHPVPQALKANRAYVDAVLRATPERLLADLNLLGFLFESLVVRDLRVYAQAADAQVLHYKDNTDLEVDAVIEAADGRWAAFGVKLGAGAVGEGAQNLLKFASRIDTKKCGAPQGLAVITATGLAYARPDGVGVIPIGALGP